MKIKESFIWFLEGVVMGLANIIPGVSGGTMALLMGIYERLIHSINTIPLKSPFSLLRGDKETFLEKVSSIDYDFLFPLILGIGSATLILARLIGTFIDDFQAITFSFFFGLILASAGTLYHRIDKFEITTLIPGTFGFLSAFYIVGLSPFQANHTLPIIFISGLVAIPSMILPGISGSFILIILQQYEYLINALNKLNIIVIAIFMSGAVTGLFSFAKLVEILFENYRKGTLVFLFGLILGGLRAPLTTAFRAEPTFAQWLIPATAGAAVVSILDAFYRLRSS
ncbi:MAG: DUF368 domain-containing protein [Candidatus Thermoplasmatota archaeon]|nr:DUF368 domain-containing protein [Candidatus Thermoplasmatota archaeon]MBS3790073.1 DUF368 domain-containing protein [Candidatus Thermoplasmatota archaeon]